MFIKKNNGWANKTEIDSEIWEKTDGYASGVGLLVGWLASGEAHGRLKLARAVSKRIAS